MDNEFHTVLGAIPAKETVDFAKNLGFVYTFQSLAIVLTTPHHGIAPPWTNTIVAWLVTIAGGTLTAMVIELYLRNWPEIKRLTRNLSFALFIFIGFLVQKTTEARLLEGM